MYYLQSRYYSPEMKRFINADVTNMLVADGNSVTQNNLFAYCENNAVNYSDPSGKFSLSPGTLVGKYKGKKECMRAIGKLFLTARFVTYVGLSFGIDLIKIGIAGHFLVFNLSQLS